MIVSIKHDLTIEEFKEELKKIKTDLQLLDKEFKIDVNHYKRELMLMSDKSMTLKEFNNVVNNSWLRLSNNDINDMYAKL